MRKETQEKQEEKKQVSMKISQAEEQRKRRVEEE